MSPAFLTCLAACVTLQVMKLVEGRPDVLLLAINFDENKTVVKAMGVKVREGHFTLWMRCVPCRA